MNEKNVFHQVREENTEYCKRILEAAKLGIPNYLAEICDEYSGFLHDVFEDLSTRANNMERYAKRTAPDKEALDIALSMANKFREFSLYFKKVYLELTKSQTQRIFPTKRNLNELALDNLICSISLN